MRTISKRKYTRKITKKLTKKRKSLYKKGGKNILQSKTTNNWSKMNCSPIVDGKTLHTDTCITAQIIYKLKEIYNSKYPDDKIDVTEPVTIWTQLKDKMRTCNKEDCWLGLITDKEERDKIDKSIFAPDHPDDWKENKHEWLSNIDIEKVLKQYEEWDKRFSIIGPSPIDFDEKKNGECVTNEICNLSLKQLSQNRKSKISIVFNLSKSTEPGSHWVSLYIDLDDKFIFFFDSTGDKIPDEVMKLVERINKQSGNNLEYYDNHRIEHQKGTSECGVYSLYFIITMLTGKDGTNNSFNNYRDKIAYFRGKRIPDNYISEFRKKYFNSPE